ncbi:hypothetical protein VE03_07125 [Pseudogymnoascus sp. 23342-1-I1]|nr:hypothetical protein VE03_07125 [Pseudogymnoascus sp. 23342-1-I1]
MEGQSTFASTLLDDIEKNPAATGSTGKKRSGNLYRAEVDTVAHGSGLDPIYASKVHVLNEALMDIGMGRYQWLLFLATSMGWFLDQFWIMAFTIIAPSTANENQLFYPNNKFGYLFISLFVGLAAGAAVWPVLADRIGRKAVFTSTVVLMGMGGLVGAGMSEFTGLCVVGAVVGFAISGNQAISVMILVESIPASHQWLVSLQGVFWGLGQLVASLIGWAFIEGWTCGTVGGKIGSATCHYVSNKGWRYAWWTFGCVTLFFHLCRLLFSFYETPKFLLAQRRDAEATQVIKEIASSNKTSTWLSESHFARIDSTMGAEVAAYKEKGIGFASYSSVGSLRSITSSLGFPGITSLLLLWITTGLSFTLYQTYIPNYIGAQGDFDVVSATSVSTNSLFSYYAEVATFMIPGPIIATLLIELKSLGRQRTGAILAFLTGLIMLVSTQARTNTAYVVFECVLAVLQYASQAVLITYTVEILDTPARGLGLGITGFVWRAFGLVAEIVATYVGEDVGQAPAVWFCGALWVLMSAVWFGLPRDTRGAAVA